MSYTYETQFNSGNFTSAADALKVFGMAREIEGFTLHWWGDPSTNPSYEGVRSYLCRTGGNTSAHIVTTGTGRRASCIVDYNNIAWHAGSAWGNARTIGIELDPRCRPEDKDVFAEVLADLRSAFGDKPLYWHSYFSSTTCPGVYRDLVDELDQLSYTKFSDPIAWGKGGTIPAKAPVPPPVAQPTPSTTPSVILWKLLDAAGKQVAAYSVEANAWKGYNDDGRVGKIMYNGTDVTAELTTKFTAPSPTTHVDQDQEKDKLPDTGKPVAEKDDFKDISELLKQILAAIQWIKDKWPFK
jgi:hypothetical protein